MLRSFERWWGGLSTGGKAALGAVTVGGLLFVTRSAGAQSLPGGGGSAAAQLGDAHAALAAGDLVMLPGAFHLRTNPTAQAASGDPELPAQVLRITGPARRDVTRGGRETLYPVALGSNGARTGWAFVPYNATRATAPTGGTQPNYNRATISTRLADLAGPDAGMRLLYDLKLSCGQWVALSAKQRAAQVARVVGGALAVPARGGAGQPTTLLVEAADVPYLVAGADAYCQQYSATRGPSNVGPTRPTG